MLLAFQQVCSSLFSFEQVFYDYQLLDFRVMLCGVIRFWTRKSEPAQHFSMFFLMV